MSLTPDMMPGAEWREEFERAWIGWTEDVRRLNAVLAAKDAEIERLRAGIRKVVEEGVPRKVAEPYATDGRPHKGDRCPHGAFTWESCDACTDEYLASLLAETPDRAPHTAQNRRTAPPRPDTPESGSGDTG